jgi:hypothetical protein
MSVQGLFPLPGSPDLARLIQKRLDKVQRQFPALCPRTLEDVCVLTEKLSAITKVCDTVTDKLVARNGPDSAADALQQIEHALDWLDCTVC